jgi:glycosyltransferase involved in cell wall biosynthesis
MMGSPLKISVITVVFNRRDTIEDTFRSVSSQRYENVEHIVVDGGSSDGTMDVLNARRDQIDVLLSEPDRGIYDALNKGIALATGDVVGFLHADDVFADTRVLSRIADAFADDAVGAVYGDLVYVQEGDMGRVVRHWSAGHFSKSKLAWGWMPPHPTFYARRSLYAQLGGFDLRYRIAADYDTMLRFLGRGEVQAAYIPEVLVKMRLGGVSNRSLANILQKSREDYLVLRRNGVGGLGALVWKNLSKVAQFFGGAQK